LCVKEVLLISDEHEPLTFVNQISACESNYSGINKKKFKYCGVAHFFIDVYHPKKSVIL